MAPSGAIHSKLLFTNFIQLIYQKNKRANIRNRYNQTPSGGGGGGGNLRVILVRVCGQVF